VTTTVGQDVLIRNLLPGDQHAVVSIDARSMGRMRTEFFKVKLRQAFADTSIAISLAAVCDGTVVGFLLARVYYGEFGRVDPAAVIDVLGVHPDFRGRHVASAMLEQLRTNLGALGIHTIQTEVAWDNPELLTFFNHEGFVPAKRLCLDLDLRIPRKRKEES
jgi:ribosomal protein S18 acetylase RimI-like enzyme